MAPKMKETGAHDKVLRTYDLSPPDCNYRCPYTEVG